MSVAHANQVSQVSEAEALYRCLCKLLELLKGDESGSFVEEYFPQKPIGLFELSDVYTTLANARFVPQSAMLAMELIDDSQMPCLYLLPSGIVTVIISRHDEFYTVYDPYSENNVSIPPGGSHGLAILAQVLDAKELTLLDRQKAWFEKVLLRFRRPIAIAFAISLVISTLAIVSPLMVMLSFRQMAVATSLSDLSMLLLGIALYLLALGRLRFLRSSLLAYIATRIGHIVKSQVVRRILYLPPSYTEMASVGAQLARIRDFESIQDFLSGNAAVALLEIPFILILLGAMFAVAGPIGFVPVTAAVLFAGFGFVINGVIKRSSVTAASAAKEFQDFRVSSLMHVRDIRALYLTSRWMNHFRELSARATLGQFKSTLAVNLISAFSYGLVALAGMATMALGVSQIISGALSPEALMASMMLTWRILAPLRSGFMVLAQLSRVKSSVAQVDHLMNLPLEDRAHADAHGGAIEGNIQFSQVSLRYTQNAHPALLGVNFEVKKGEILVIVGHGGCGKTSILKLILGMYFPQTGRVLIDNINSKQLHPVGLRRKIAYMAEETQIINGTIRETLYLANPQATPDSLQEALEDSGLWYDISRMPEGLDTRINDQNIHLISSSFLRRLALSMVMLRNANVWLLDNPGMGMDKRHEMQMIQVLGATKGMATIVICTQNPDYLTIADRALLLNNGRVGYFGEPKELIRRYMEKGL